MFLSAQLFSFIPKPPDFQYRFWKLYFVEMKNENFRPASFDESLGKIGKFDVAKIGNFEKFIDPFW